MRRTRRARTAVAALLLLGIVIASTVGPAAATAFGPDRAVPLPPQMLTVLGVRVAVSATQARIVWSGLTTDPDLFHVTFAALPLHTGDVTTTMIPFGPALSSSGVPVRVAALSADEFVFAWLDPSPTLWVAIQETGGRWRGPFPTIAGLAHAEALFDLATWDGWIYLAWVEQNAQNGTVIVSRVSPFDGVSKADVRVDADPTMEKFESSLAMAHGEAYLAWRRGTGNTSSVVFAHGAVGGTWSSPLSVSGNAIRPWEFQPELDLAPNGTAVVVYDDWSAVRDSSGPIRNIAAVAEPPYAAFQPGWDLGAAVHATLPGTASLAFNATGAMHVVWSDGIAALETTPDRILYSESQDWSTFTPPQQLTSDMTPSARDRPVIAIGANDTVIVAWDDSRSGPTPRPYFAMSIGPPAPPAWLPYAFAAGLAGGGAAVGAVGYSVVSLARRKRRERARNGRP